MAVTALLKFIQGTTSTGQAKVVTAGTAVTIRNDVNTNVKSWRVELLYAPPGSPTEVAGGGPKPGSPQVIAENSDSSNPDTTITPDVDWPGCYRIRLTVYSLKNFTGDADVDIRNICVLTPNRKLVLPPYQMLPAPLPLTGTGSKPDELNFEDQVYGWTGPHYGFTGNFRIVNAALLLIEAMSPSGGDNYEMAFGLSGNITFADKVKVTSTSDGIAFGTDAAQSGTGVRFSAGDGITYRFSGNDIRAVRWESANLIIGDTSSNYAGLVLQTDSYVTFTLRLGGTYQWFADYVNLPQDQDYSFRVPSPSSPGPGRILELRGGPPNSAPQAGGGVRFVSYRDNSGAANGRFVLRYMGGGLPDVDVAELGVDETDSDRTYLSLKPDDSITVDSEIRALEQGLRFRVPSGKSFSWFHVGDNIASTGFFRWPRREFLYARNDDNDGDIGMIGMVTGNLLQLGVFGSNPGAVFGSATAGDTKDDLDILSWDTDQLRYKTVSEVGGALKSVTLTAGSGLTGGGDLTANRTFNVVANADGSITVNADDIQVGVLASDAQHGVRGGGTQHAVATVSVAGFMSASDKTALNAAVPNTRTLTAGTNLSGGGDLSADRTFNLNASLVGMNKITYADEYQITKSAGVATVNPDNGTKQRVTIVNNDTLRFTVPSPDQPCHLMLRLIASGAITTLNIDTPGSPTRNVIAAGGSIEVGGADGNETTLGVYYDLDGASWHLTSSPKETAVTSATMI